MLSMLYQTASQLENNNKSVKPKKCGFCKCEGHSINQCKSQMIDKLDDHIMQVVAITSKFPFMKNLCIKKELENLTFIELKALSYKFDSPKENKKYMKYKNSLLWLLTKYYYDISKNDNDYSYNLLNPYLVRLYSEFQFNLLNPLRTPDISLLKRCADIVYEHLPDENSHYFRMSSWISLRVEDYYRDYTEYMKSQESKPHRFDIFSCVQEQLDEPYESFDCPICQEDIGDKNVCIELGCKHKFCSGCITMQLDTASKTREFKHPNCAMCRAPITDLYFKSYSVGESIHEKYIDDSRFLINLVDF